MKNQVKVKETEVFTDPQGSRIVCVGKLVLIKSHDVDKSNVYLDGIGHTSYIVSETEAIKDEDRIIHKGELLIVSKNRGHYLSTYKYTHLDLRTDNCSKVLATPINFSPKHLQAIVDGKLKDGMKVLVKCENVAVDYVTDTWSPEGHYVGKQIELNESEHITFFAFHKDNSLADKLFQLANEFATAKQGNIAVKLHAIHNTL